MMFPPETSWQVTVTAWPVFSAAKKTRAAERDGAFTEEVCVDVVHDTCDADDLAGVLLFCSDLIRIELPHQVRCTCSLLRCCPIISRWRNLSLLGGKLQPLRVQHRP